MVNRFSPALDYYPLEPASVVAPAPPVRYPSVPAGLRLMRTGLGALHRLSPELGFRAAWRLFLTPRRLPVRAWEHAVLADAHRQPVRLSSGKTVMAYHWGTPDQPAVLLLHGWEHRAAFWADFIPALRTAGYRVVALDGPAHGASDGRRTTLVEYAHAIQAVADGIEGELRAAVAHSFGAAAVSALELRVNAGAGLPRLVLLSAPGSMRAVAERFAALLRLPGSVVDRISRHIQQQFGRDPEAFSLTQRGPALAVDRALLLHDRHDEFVPFHEAETVARAWPALRFEPTTGLGHNRILRDAAVIARVKAFLAE